MSRPWAWLLPVLLLGAALLASLTPPGRLASDACLDQGFRLLRLLAPAAAPSDDVVLVGIDEASIAASGKPFALMLDELAALLDGLRVARVRAAALDLVLPGRPYDELVPGASRRLAQAVASLRRTAPLVLGTPASWPADADAGRLYALLAGSDGLATLQVPLDPDGRLRRIETGSAAGAPPPLAARLAKRLGIAPADGLVDFAHGAAFGYMPLSEVVARVRAGDAAFLRARFGGKIVLVGAVLPDQDRQRLPVRLAAWEHGDSVAGVVFQAQALRSMLAGRIVAPLPWLGAVQAALALALLWPLRRRPLPTLAAALALAAVLAGVDLALLAHGRWAPPLAAWLLLAACAMAAWLGAYRRHRAEQRRVKAIFAGYVSPAILDTILGGVLRERALRQPLAFLFADIRGFTQMCASMPPEAVIAFLNRYYAAITPALHRHKGTIDKFSGDGIMVFFGAPLPSDNPARDALAAALDLLSALDDFNLARAAEGLARVEIGIGIAYGDAILGNVGSPERHDYTATGAATTLAAHIQQRCKSTPYALLLERGAFERAAPDPALRARFDLLELDIDKHGPTALAGWRTTEDHHD